MAAEFCGCILGEFCGVSFSFDFVWLGYMSFIHLAYLKLGFLQWLLNSVRYGFNFTCAYIFYF